jgi:plastocyanin
VTRNGRVRRRPEQVGPDKGYTMRQSWSWVLPRAVLLLSTIATAAGVLAGCATTSNTTPPADTAQSSNTAPGDTANAQPAQATPGMPGMPGMAGMAGVAGQAPAAAPAAAAPVATNTVAIQNFAFAPAVVTVKVGTTITWTNQDQDSHTVTAMNDGPFHSPAMNTGDTYRYTFTKAGHYDYLCTIHPFMTATVVVTP